MTKMEQSLVDTVYENYPHWSGFTAKAAFLGDAYRDAVIAVKVTEVRYDVDHHNRPYGVDMWVVGRLTEFVRVDQLPHAFYQFTLDWGVEHKMRPDAHIWLFSDIRE